MTQTSLAISYLHVKYKDVNFQLHLPFKSLRFIFNLVYNCYLKHLLLETSNSILFPTLIFYINLKIFPMLLKVIARDEIWQ